MFIHIESLFKIKLYICDWLIIPYFHQYFFIRETYSSFFITTLIKTLLINVKLSKFVKVLIFKVMIQYYQLQSNFHDKIQNLKQNLFICVDLISGARWEIWPSGWLFGSAVLNRLTVWVRNWRQNKLSCRFFKLKIVTPVVIITGGCSLETAGWIHLH